MTHTLNEIVGVCLRGTVGVKNECLDNVSSFGRGMWRDL